MATPDLIARLTRTDATQLIRALNAGLSHTIHVQHRNGGETFPVRALLTDEDAPTTDLVITITDVDPDATATVVVHNLAIEETLGGDPRPCAHVTVTMPGTTTVTADPVRIEYGDFEAGQVYTVNGRTLEVAESYEDALAPDGDYYDLALAVGEYLDELVRGVGIVMVQAVTSPVLDPIRYAVDASLEGFRSTERGTDGTATVTVNYPDQQED